MTTISTVLTYPFASFKNSCCEIEILKRELLDAGITASDISLIGTNAIITFSKSLTSQEVSSCDAVVAAHTGSSFQPCMQSFVVPDDGSVDDGYTSSTNWVDALSFDTGALPQSWYQIMWSNEMYAETGNIVERRILINGVNTVTELSEISTDSWDKSTWRCASGGVWIYRRAGEHLSVKFQYKTSGGKSYIRRRRFSLIHIGMSVN